MKHQNTDLSDTPDTQGEKKIDELLNDENNYCHKCGYPGYKTDGNGKVWCIKCLDKALKRKPIVKGAKTGRNEQCVCGSGKKFKKCCLGK